MPAVGTHGSQWQAHGYSGNGNVASLIDSQWNRPAIVAGGSHTVFMDFYEASQVVENPLVFAVNDVGMYLPKVDHWVSLHCGNLEVWRLVRFLHAKELVPLHYHTYEAINPDWHTWDGLNPMFALSGYFAMQIAWIMGCSPIILAGCPGNKSRRFFEFLPKEASHGEPGVMDQVIQEMNRLPEFKRVVRSMSGWTRELFNHSEGRSKWPLLQR